MRWLRPLILLIFVAFGLALFYDVLVGGRVFFWNDVTCAAMPLRKVAADAVRAGHLPFWAPGIACGFPVLAEGQAAVFYPLNAIGYLGVPYYYAYSWVAAAQCLLAALGTALLGRRLGLGWLAVAYAGLAFGFSGYFVSKIMFIAVLQSGAWLPWLLWCLISGLETGRWPWFVAGAVVLSLSILGGHPQIVFYELLALLLLALWYLFLPGPTAWGRRSARAVLGTGLLLAGGAGLAALQILPTLALTRFAATRTDTGAGLLRSLSLRPYNLALFIHPYLFGSYGENNYWGQDHYFEVCAYVGGLTVLLAVVAVWRRGLPLRHKGYWIALGVFGVFMALAAHNPLYDVLPRLPGFSYFRAPARYLLLTTLSLSLLAGAMIQALGGSRRHAAGRSLAAWSLAGLLAAGAVVGGLHLARPQIVRALGHALPAAEAAGVEAPGDLTSPAPPKAEAKWQFLVERLGPRDPIWVTFLGSLLAAGLLGLWAWRGDLPYRPAAALLLALLAGQLYLFGHAANATAPPDYYLEPPQVAQLFHQDHTWGRAYGDPATEWQSFTGRDYPGYLSGDLTPYWEEREVLRRNRAELYNVPAAHAFYTLLPERQVRLLDDLVPEGLAGRPGGAGAPLQILRMLGVRMLIAAPGLHSSWLQPEGGDATGDAPRYGVYRVTDPLPSAWLALRAVPCATEVEARQALAAPTFRPEETALVEGLGSSAQRLGGGGVVRLKSQEPERMEWEVDAPSSSFLVLNMAYNPNWRAKLDGHPVSVYRTNYMQCGLAVPAGASRVVAWYQDNDFRQGLQLTKLSAVALAALLLLMGACEVAAKRRPLP
jgi:hypothetical protein